MGTKSKGHYKGEKYIEVIMKIYTIVICTGQAEEDDWTQDVKASRESVAVSMAMDRYKKEDGKGKKIKGWQIWVSYTPADKVFSSKSYRTSDTGF